MKEVGVQNLINEIVEANSDVLFISAINYEKRSLQWLKIINRMLLQQYSERQMHLYRLAVENSGQMISMLNEITKSHVFEYENIFDTFIKRIAKEKINIKLTNSVKLISLRNLTSVNEIIYDLQGRLNLEPPFQLVFDITALPRKVILLMMEVVVKLLEEKKVNNLFILYTWPLRYPSAGRSTNTGLLKVENARVTLSQFLSNNSEVYGIMTLGRDGSIGRLFLESMPIDSKIDAFFHVKKDDYLYAFHNLLENSNVSSYIDNNPSTTLNYYLSVSRGYEAIMSKIKGTLYDWNLTKIDGLNRTLLIAPFGPKPMMITAFIADRFSRIFFNKNNLFYRSGIVHVSSFQQNDLYSVGSKDTSCYKILISDLMGEYNAN